jgi:CRISPR/Cas system CMR-associated protein Cmr1 (group 7 of RAMP superfamily)
MEKSGMSKKEKHFSIKDDCKYNTKDIYDIYAEEYNDLGSVIDRIQEIENIWINKHDLQTLNYWNTNQRNTKHNTEFICVSVVLYNQWMGLFDVGMHCNRWVIPSVSEYTKECKSNTEKTAAIEPRTINIYVPEETELFDYQFISKEKSIELIRDFLDTGDIHRDFLEPLEHPYFQ